MAEVMVRGLGGRCYVAEIDRVLREALTAYAQRLGLDPATITSPSPGVLTASTPNGVLLRLDVSTYVAIDADGGQ